MSIMHTKKNKTPTYSSPNYSNVLDSSSSCPRCQGLFVRVFCMDMLDSTNENGFWVLRCVQCGELRDSLILQHRNSNPELGLTRSPRPPFPVTLTSSPMRTPCRGKHN